MTSEELLRRFRSVPDYGQRLEILGSWVRACPDDVVAGVLGELARAGLRRRPEALQAVLAWIVMTTTPGNPVTPRENALFRQRPVRDDPLLATLLQPPFPVVTDDLPPPRVLSGRDGRPLTLGERRWAARKPDRILLDKLLADPDPGVIARLLRNPSLTEREAVRIAAWRPGRPEVLVEVLRCFRWSVRPIVQAALARNPATPPAVATRLTLLLPAPKVREVLRDGETPMLVRLACRRLAEAIAATRKPRPAAGRG